MSGRMELHDNLSESRGSRSGIRSMMLMLRILGVRRTCEFCRVIALFYALFDRTAREKAGYYLNRRFPGATPFRRFLHTWALFTSQGQALIEAAAAAEGKITITENGRENAMNETRQTDHGTIILCSHFGEWQAMMRVINTQGKPCHILMQPDRNENVDKFLGVHDKQSKIGIISTEGPMGGLIDVYDALMNGDTVCIMGDRHRESEATTVSFLGAEAHFPIAAFQLAARTGASIVPVFAFRENHHRTIRVVYGDPIYPPASSRRTKRSELVPYLQQYVSSLEQMAQDHPYECFIFENIWS